MQTEMWQEARSDGLVFARSGHEGGNLEIGRREHIHKLVLAYGTVTEPVTRVGFSPPDV
jgi:hypothetical protein